MKLDKIARRLVICPRCGAQPGDECRTATGGRVGRNHTPRSKAVYEGWHDGYDCALRFAVLHPEAAARMVARNKARREEVKQ